MNIFCSLNSSAVERLKYVEYTSKLHTDQFDGGALWNSFGLISIRSFHRENDENVLSQRYLDVCGNMLPNKFQIHTQVERHILFYLKKHSNGIGNTGSEKSLFIFSQDVANVYWIYWYKCSNWRYSFLFITCHFQFQFSFVFLVIVNVNTQEQQHDSICSTWFDSAWLYEIFK